MVLSCIVLPDTFKIEKKDGKDPGVISCETHEQTLAFCKHSFAFALVFNGYSELSRRGRRYREVAAPFAPTRDPLFFLEEQSSPAEGMRGTVKGSRALQDPAGLADCPIVCRRSSW